MKTSKITTCQTFTTRVLTRKEKYQLKWKNKTQHLTWRESGHFVFFVLHVFVILHYKMVFDCSILLILLLIQTLAYMVVFIFWFVCQFKIGVCGRLSLLAMDPIAQMDPWIWYWVQCDFEGYPCRTFLLVCQSQKLQYNCLCFTS